MYIIIKSLTYARWGAVFEDVQRTTHCHEAHLHSLGACLCVYVFVLWFWEYHWDSSVCLNHKNDKATNWQHTPTFSRLNK